MKLCAIFAVVYIVVDDQEYLFKGILGITRKPKLWKEHRSFIQKLVEKVPKLFGTDFVMILSFVKKCVILGKGIGLITRRLLKQLGLGVKLLDNVTTRTKNSSK